MRCPRCSSNEDHVIDTRTSVDGTVIRRRRVCAVCGYRFSTHESINRRLPRVVKRDGRREAFDPQKIERGLNVACQKRPIKGQALEHLIEEVLNDIERLNLSEISSERIGHLVMDRLRTLDPVAYIRFASVYAAFDKVDQFIAAVRDVTRGQK